MRVLVTGGAGFIGANLCRFLASSPAFESVVALDDLSTGFRSNLNGHSGVELVEGSILDDVVLRPLVAASDAVVHLAARPSVPRSIADPMATHRVNVEGMLAVLEAARSRPTPPHVIFSSSSSVYGNNPVLPKHEALTPMPRSPYAASKLAGEAYLLSYQESFGVPALAFRFFNVFGPLQAPGHAYAAVIPAFVHAALNGQPATIFGDGSQSRDFTYVGTVAEVISAALRGRVVSAKPVNLAFGSRVTLLELLELLEGKLGYSVERNHLATRAGDVQDSQADGAALRVLFPQVTSTSLDVGLGATIDWMRDAGI